MLEDKSKKKNRFLLVYGSATGQAQSIAEEIAEKAPSFGLSPELHSLEATGKRFNIENEKCMVVITSTTGDGDPPANAEKFMRRIKKKTLPEDYLSHLQYTMLGLGDTNYSNFCRCAQDMDRRLEALGAKRFYATGLADDGVGLEVVAEPWLEGLYPALQKFLGLETHSEFCLTETVRSLSLEDKDSEKIPASIVNGDKNGAKPVINGDSVSSNTNSTVLADSERTDVLSEAYTGNNDSSHNSDAEPKLKNSIVTKQLSGDEEKVLGMTAQGDAPNVDTANNRCLDLAKDHLHTAPKSAANQNVYETQCVPIEEAGSPSIIPPLTQPDPALSEKNLTVPVLPPPYLAAEFSNDPVEVSSLPYQNGCKLPCAASDILDTVISSVRVLTSPDAVKKTLLLRLDLQDTETSYSPGDSISIVCPNNTSEVNLLLQRLGVCDRADKSLTLSVIPDTKKRRAAVPPHVSPTSSLRHIFTTCLNIRESPSKAFIRALVEYTVDPNEVRRMQELCSKEGGQQYTHYIRESHVSFLDFLYAFPSCKPPVERVLEHLPRLQPRPYSVCSCLETHPNSLDIVFNVVEILGDKGQGHFYQRRGVCTGWLDDITSSWQAGRQEEKIKIPFFLRTNQHFRPPSDLTKPLIMIGPGTGVAPFIGFLQQRALQRKQLKEDQEYGETWLFFGCRNKEKDYLFREELRDLELDGTLSKLCVTFSRDQPDDSSPVCRYVQDLMKSLAPDICKLLTESEALVYLCGDAKNMAKDVNAAFEEILCKEKGMSQDDAHLFMMKKRINKTYFEDVWV